MTDKQPTYEAYFPTSSAPAAAEQSPLLAERDKTDDDRAEDQYQQFFPTAGDGTE